MVADIHGPSATIGQLSYFGTARVSGQTTRLEGNIWTFLDGVWLPLARAVQLYSVFSPVRISCSHQKGMIHLLNDSLPECPVGGIECFPRGNTHRNSPCTNRRKVSRTIPEIIEFSTFQIPASMSVVETSPGNSPCDFPEDVDFQGHAVYLVIPRNRVGTIRDPPTEINGPESTKLRVPLWWPDDTVYSGGQHEWHRYHDWSLMVPPADTGPVCTLYGTLSGDLCRPST